jgi:hypothetical protein
MDDEVKTGKYRRLSVSALVTGITAVIFCMFYFLLWMTIDDLLERLVSDFAFMSYIMFSYVSAGVCLTIAAVITGSIDLKRIKTGTYSSKDFDIAGIILGSFLIFFGFLLWFVDFFGFINIIT